MTTAHPTSARSSPPPTTSATVKPVLPARIAWSQWLRRVHGWIGLWGALLGLIFGISGIWLNHRNLLKLPPVAQQRATSQLEVPAEATSSPEDLARWLQVALQLPQPAPQIRQEPARPVPWAEAASGGAPTLRQPARWTITFGGPRHSVQADWWVGNRSLSVRTTDNGWLATLQNLHKGTGLQAPWILLVDTLAGSIILLSLSGVALWMLTHRRRTVGVIIIASAAAVVTAAYNA